MSTLVTVRTPGDKQKRIALAKQRKQSLGQKWLSRSEYRKIRQQQTKNVSAKDKNRSQQIVKMPSKQRKNRQVKEAPKRAIATDISVKGPDSRKQSVKDSLPNILQNQTSTVVISETLVPSALFSSLLPLITVMYQKGFLQIAFTDGQSVDSVFYLYGFLQRYLYFCSRKITPPAMKIPLWLSYYAQAITPKIVKFATGSIDYRWDQGSDPVYNGSIITLNPVNPVIRYNIGSPASTTESTSGYIGWVPTRGAYTDTLGQQAYQTLDSMFSNDGGYRMVENSYKTPLFQEPSAFAINNSTQGYSGLNVGSYWSLIQNEVKTRFPMYSMFADADPSSGLARKDRVPNIGRSFSGDSSTLVATLVSKADGYTRSLNQIPYRFKFIDFNELWVAWTSWIQGCFMAKQQQATAGVALPSSLNITQLQAQILFRQALMANFSDSQHYAMSITYNDSTGFFPFLPSTNCYGDAAFLEFQLPCGIAENLKCLRMRTTFTQGTRSEYTLVPILGMYVKDTIDWNPLWAPGQRIFTVSDDVQYNIYEGSVQVDTFIEHNGMLAKATLGSYNGFIQTNFSNTSVPMVNLSDNGISALEVLSMTRIWQEVPITTLSTQYFEQMIKLFPNRTRYVIALNKLRGNVKQISAVTNQQFCQLTTSQQPLLRNAWADVQDHWILPSFRTSELYAINTASIDLQLSAFEPYSYGSNISFSNTSDGLNLNQHAEELGALNIVGQGGNSPGFCKIIEMAAAKSQGDDIGNLITSFAEWMGGPTLGRFAGASYDLIKSIL